MTQVRQYAYDFLRQTIEQHLFTTDKDYFRLKYNSPSSLINILQLRGTVILLVRFVFAVVTLACETFVNICVQKNVPLIIRPPDLATMTDPTRKLISAPSPCHVKLLGFRNFNIHQLSDEFNSDLNIWCWKSNQQFANCGALWKLFCGVGT